MNLTARLLLLALGLCVATVALDLIAIFVVAIATSDDGVRTAERAAVFLLGFEAVMLMVATAVFWLFSRELAIWPRVFATLGTLVPQTVIALTLAFFSLLMLNR